MNARYSAPLSALPWAPLTLPRTSLLRAFGTVARRLARHAWAWPQLRVLDALIALNQRRYLRAGEAYYLARADDDPLATCQAKERQWRYKLRLRQLSVDSWHLALWVTR